MAIIKYQGRGGEGGRDTCEASGLTACGLDGNGAFPHSREVREPHVFQSVKEKRIVLRALHEP